MTAAANRLLGVALIILSGAAFGTLALFGRLVYAVGVDPPTLLFLRFSLAAAVMGLLLGLRPRRLPRGRILLTLVLMGGVGYVSQSLAYFTALTVRRPAWSPCCSTSIRAFTVFSMLAFHERLQAVKVTALVVELLGLACTIGPTDGGRPQLPGRHQQLEVPRNDLGHHADRLTERVGSGTSRGRPRQRSAAGETQGIMASHGPTLLGLLLGAPGQDRTDSAVTRPEQLGSRGSRRTAARCMPLTPWA